MTKLVFSVQSVQVKDFLERSLLSLDTGQNVMLWQHEQLDYVSLFDVFLQLEEGRNN